MKFLLNILNSINGWKYVIGILVALVGQWYDLKTDIRLLQSDISYINKRDDKQEKDMEQVGKDIKEELKELRNDIRTYSHRTK